MALIDSYRSTMLRKRDELIKLKEKYANEHEKIEPLQRKIISAKKAISRTKSSATIKAKLSEIDRANNSIIDIEKRCNDIQDKINRKEKEYNAADRKYREEELKLNKKASEAEKRRLQESARRSDSMEEAIHQQSQLQLEMQKELDQMKAIPEKITILFLAANPLDSDNLQLDEEARAIHEKIRLAEYRDSVEFVSRWAVRSSDILQAINETNPTIVHFSGHGTEDGELVLQNPDGSAKYITAEAISAAIATASDSIRLIVFNTCFSEIQAESVVEYIESAIGTSRSISDDAARVFAAQLYSSISFGHSLKKAFDQAKAGLLLENIPGEDIPRLYCRNDITLDDMILVQPKSSD